MQDLLWMKHLPGETLEGGIALVNRLYWSITWNDDGQRWCVWAGEDLLLRTDSRESADAFLYGLGLAYSVLPTELFEQLAIGMRHLVDPD